MKISKLSALVAAPLLLGATLQASAAPTGAINLVILGPVLGEAALPGTGVNSFGVDGLGGLALALKNNDGEGHSVVGLTLALGFVPQSVDTLPGLPSGPVQLGIQGPSLGDAIPLVDTNKYTLPGLGSAELTLTNNDGAEHSNVGLAVTPMLP